MVFYLFTGQPAVNHPKLSQTHVTILILYYGRYFQERFEEIAARAKYRKPSAVISVNTPIL